MTEFFSNPNLEDNVLPKYIKNRFQISPVKSKKLIGKIRKFKATIYNLIGNKSATTLKNVKAKTDVKIGMNGPFNSSRFLF